MKKTEAIRVASRAVSKPIRAGSCSYHLYGPYSDNLSGPSTEVSYDSYWKARARRTEWVAHIVVTLMGHDEATELVDEITSREGQMPVRELVDAVMRRYMASKGEVK